MQRDTLRHKVFTRRALIFAGGASAMTSVLLGRLYYLQVLQSDRYRVLAEENRISLRLLPPPRGRVLDRTGAELAKNQRNYRVLLIPEQTRSVDNTLTVLTEIVPMEEHVRRRVQREAERNAGFMPVTVVENLTWQEFAAINVNMPDLPGVQPDVGESRFYPYGEAFAHVVGYVGPVSPDEQTGDPLLKLPGFRTGKSGVERVRESALRGSAGNSQVEVNAYGRVIRELARKDGEPGGDVRLSIDAELQRFAQGRLGTEAGAAVVLDIHTGEVLTLVSSPSFDPNAFNLGLSRDDWQALVGHERKPLLHRAVTGLYAPGSTFKIIVALAALENGIVGTDHRVFCGGDTALGDHTFHCWKKEGHGELDLVRAIAQSCDVYFYDIARRTGIDRISRMAKRFGLGDVTDLEVVGEREGLVPTRDWKSRRRGEAWQQGETLVTGIGQGYLLSTPLQLAVMVAQIANGGFRVHPTLFAERPAVRDDGSRDQAARLPARESLDLAPSAMTVIQDAMNQVTNDWHGTAFRARIRAPGLEMAGKTGTSQVRRITKAERATRILKNEELPWEERDHALFVGYAPVSAPRYAIAVVVEHGGGGSTAAAPIARDILTEVQRRDPARVANPSSVPQSPARDA
jgi:penicillin-binding protein 2